MKYIFSLLMILCCVAPVFVYAQTDLLQPTCSGANGITDNSGAAANRECTFADLVAMAQEIATAVVKIALFVAPLIFAYAGYLYLVSGANPNNRKKAAGIFKNVVIGICIMLAAWVIVNLVLTALVNSTILNNAAFPFQTANPGS